MNTKELIQQLEQLDCRASIGANTLTVSHAKCGWLKSVLESFDISVTAKENEGSKVDSLCVDLSTGDIIEQSVVHAIASALQPQAMIFDMDGVLADVTNSFRQAIVETAKDFGASPTFSEIQELKAQGNANNDWVVTQRLLAMHSISADLAAVTERFQQYYQGSETVEGLKFRETLIPPREFLVELASRYPMAIVTGRPRVDSDWYLDYAGISEFFQGAVCMEDGQLKPSPKPVLRALEILGVDRAWMFGDTPDDIVAARKAGVIAVGVAAPCDEFETARELLTSCGAAAVVKTVDQITEFLP